MDLVFGPMVWCWSVYCLVSYSYLITLQTNKSEVSLLLLRKIIFNELLIKKMYIFRDEYLIFQVRTSSIEVNNKDKSRRQQDFSQQWSMQSQNVTGNTIMFTIYE